MHHLENQIFGKLTAVRFISKKKRGWWLCRCSCGQEVTVQTFKLLSGHTKSCGCWRKEQPLTRMTHGETRGHRSGWSPRTKMLYAARARSKKFNLPCDITIDDIVVPETCPVLGLSIAKQSNRCQPNSPSLDRIIPEKGYIKGNVRVISHKANTIKSDATVEDLQKVLDDLKKLSAGREEGQPA